MANMGVKRIRLVRDYFTEDGFRIHAPDITRMDGVHDKGIMMCDCCFDGFNTDVPNESLYRYNYPGTSRRRIKELYCSACLEHFGAVACPFVRGVPAHNTVDAESLKRMRSL